MPTSHKFRCVALHAASHMFLIALCACPERLHTFANKECKLTIIEHSLLSCSQTVLDLP